MEAPASHAFEERLGELVMRIDAPSLPQLFVEAGRALAEVMRATPLEAPTAVRQDVTANARDREALLVEWLNELVLRSEVSTARFTELEITHLSDRQLVATIRGTRVEQLRNPVRAATYNGLSIAERGGRVVAEVIFEL
jgi:SHS2 domain-containing protein